MPFITALPALYQRVPDKAEAARVVESALSDAIKQPALAPAAWTAIGRMPAGRRQGGRAGGVSHVGERQRAV